MRIVYDTVPVSGDFSEQYGNYGISQWFHQTSPVKVDVYLIHKYENFQSTKGYLVHIGDEPAYFSGFGHTYEEAVAECNKIVEKLELRLVDRPLMVSLMKIDQWDFENHEWKFTRSGSNKLEEFFEYEESVRASIEPLRGFEEGSNFTASYEVPSMWGMTTQEWTFEKDPTDPRWYRGYVDGEDMGVFSVRQWIGKMERQYNKAL